MQFKGVLQCDGNVDGKKISDIPDRSQKSAMKMKQKCFVIPHKKDEHKAVKVEDIGKEVDVPVEGLLARIIEQLQQEERKCEHP